MFMQCFHHRVTRGGDFGASKALYVMMSIFPLVEGYVGSSGSERGLSVSRVACATVS